jgi:uncharacterized protein
LEHKLTYFLLAFIALLAGTLIGAVGIGGVLLIPALINIVGLDVHQASATALITFSFTGALGTYLFYKQGTISWRMSIPVCLGALVASYLGAELNIRTPDQLLIIVIGLIVVGAGFWALRTSKRIETQASEKKSSTVQNNFTLLFCLGLIAGFGSGLSGAGGPLFLVPLMLAFNFNYLALVGVAQVLQVVASSAGSIANIINGQIVFTIVAFMVPFELIGIFIGVTIAHKAEVGILKKLAAWLCILVGIYMTVNPLVKYLKIS